ncbi:MAG: sugar phosphate nucleotidyltransferase [Patescibacteria group bacterium]|jgi:UTP--glucose-1-phosphate uridylyltransferase
MPKLKRKIKKAVVPAGGYGTRFLPATKSIPKEMFPMGNKPIILHVVEELVASGIEEIIFIVSHHKQSIESFFAANEILEDFYLKNGKKDQVKELQRIENLAEFSFVYTHPPYGNGGCLAAARHLLQDEPFVLVWADELIVTRGEPRVRQCLDVYEKYHKPVISAVRIPNPEERKKYGMAELKPWKGESKVKKIIRIAEKPELGKEPSEWATHGAYVLTPDVFKAFDKTVPGKGGELWLADILNNFQDHTDILACLIKDGDYYDCGNPLAYLKSQVDYATKYSPYAKEARDFICKRACDLDQKIKKSSRRS